mgnify:CR=1 FL=1
MTTNSNTIPDKLIIRNIILDLGGVVLDIDYNLTLKAFEKHGLKLNDHTTFTGSNELFNQFDCGLVNPDTFRKEFNQLFGVNFKTQEFDNAWNALLLSWDAERLSFIEQLKKDYRVYLLSNTNVIHFNHYNQLLVEETGKELKEFFHKVYLSFEMGIRKPQVEIFQRLIEENELVPSETLFVDDTFEHVAAAQKLGIQAIHLEGGNRNKPLVKALKGFLG